MREIEILAPAGSLDSLYAALRMGADAVYTGTSRFGARAFADNPNVDELAEAVTYAHLRQKKIYLTVNTLLNDGELEQELFPLIAPLYEAGLDACIVQDIGVLSFLHENFPDMELHASTQMTLLAADEAELYRDLGITRFVPARECTIEEIRQMRNQTDLEIEVFVHGSLCYCYSGQCLMSEVIGGRSGNRGMCAQPCRLPFDSPWGRGHLFSPKDLCTLPYIPELVEAGIDSFKIEGRMKKKEYSAYLASLYRYYVDLYQKEGADYYQSLLERQDSELWRDIRRCRDLYNRGGFCGGYLFEAEKKDIMYPAKNGHYGTLVGTVVRSEKGGAVFRAHEKLHYQDVLEFRMPDDTKAYEYTVKNEASAGELVTCKVQKGSTIFSGQQIYRTRNAALTDRVNEKLAQIDDRITLAGRFSGEIGKPVTLTVTGADACVTVTGSVLQRAKKRPVTETDIEERLNKMGNTLYRWETLEIRLADDAFLPLGEIGRLRREAIQQWEQSAVCHRVGKEPEKFRRRKAVCYEGAAIVAVADERQLAAVLQTSPEKVLLHVKLGDFSWKEWKRLPELIGERAVALSFPAILRGEGYRRFLQVWSETCLWEKMNISVVEINSHRSLLLAQKYIPEAIRIAGDHFYASNQRAIEVLQEFGIRPSVPASYGREAVMVTEGCLKRTMGCCDRKKEQIPVRSAGKDEFFVVNHCDSCYNTIYTKQVFEKEAGDFAVRLDFTGESPQEMRKVLKKWNLL